MKLLASIIAVAILGLVTSCETPMYISNLTQAGSLKVTTTDGQGPPQVVMNVGQNSFKAIPIDGKNVIRQRTVASAMFSSDIAFIEELEIIPVTDSCRVELIHGSKMFDSSILEIIVPGRATNVDVTEGAAIVTTTTTEMVGTSN